MVGLQTPLRTVLGEAAPKITRAWGYTTVGEFVRMLPRGYLDPSRPTDFSALAHDERVVVLATVVSAVSRPMRHRRGRLLLVTIVDDGGHEMDLTFFSAYGHESRLRPNVRIICSGTVGLYRDRGQLTHPEYQVLPGDGSGVPLAFREGPIPVYREAKGLNSMVVTSAMELVLHALEGIDDPIPAQVRAAHRLPDLTTAYRMVHQPRTESEHRRGRHRLKWQEAFVIQAALAQRRLSAAAVPARPRLATPDGLAADFARQLPFALTAGQQEVSAQISGDLARELPMNRLLQGEVGSGKTVVALLAMLAVVDSGAQAALLAPTEVLAAQHHRSITAMLGPLAEAGMLGGSEHSTRVALLTGSQGAAERRENLALAAGGAAGIVVGTHALIQDRVQFAELGLVVVDEQHRFGVHQRDALRAKANRPGKVRDTTGTRGHGEAHETGPESEHEAEQVAPHVLVMTATPIPRTVAMTVYGDMEISVLRELPAGRMPITTHVVNADKAGWVQRTWQRVAEEVAAGGQVYVVCPRIGEEEDPDLPHGDSIGPGMPMTDEGSDAARRRDETDPQEDGEDYDTTKDAEAPTLHGVHQVLRALRALPATADLSIGLVHGRLPPEEKDATMRAFAAGEVQVLVATTVIEVGVDVPNATQMVILDADRFGVSQLHQLRGRVGRGGKPGLCLLMTQSGDQQTPERLAAVAATTDGFELARMDLELRREGDVLGAMQSGGRSSLELLKLSRDEDLIVAAHEAAWEAVQDDPELEQTPGLAAALAQIDADRAAFLERG